MVLGGVLLFWPLVVVVEVAIIIAGIIWGVSRLSKDTKSMIVFGPTGSGKTTWYNYLRGISGNPKNTPDREEYESFEFKRKDDSTLIIKKGYDYGGRPQNYKKYMKAAMEESGKKAVFFIFSLYEYLNSDDYKINTIEYLGALSNYCTETSLKIKDDIQFYIIMSFANQVSNLNEARKNVISELKSQIKTYLPDSNNWVPLDMRNKDHLDSFKNRLKI